MVFVFVKEYSFNLVQDPALLEFAWIELVEKNKRVKVEELAEVLNFPSRLCINMLLYIIFSCCSSNDHFLYRR